MRNLYKESEEDSDMKNLTAFLWAVMGMGIMTLIIVMLSSIIGCNDGRNHGSNIPIDPTCVELVTDECVPEIIEEFCDVCEMCPPPVICPPPVVCPPPTRECFVRETEKVCVQWRYHRCCEWEETVTFVPVDCSEPDEVEVP